MKIVCFCIEVLADDSHCVEKNQFDYVHTVVLDNSYSVEAKDAKNSRLSVCLRAHLYRKASCGDTLSSLMLYDVGFHTTRGGGSETGESKTRQLTASEQKQIRFVCFLCLLDIHDDQATPMEMYRIVYLLEFLSIKYSERIF